MIFIMHLFYSAPLFYSGSSRAVFQRFGSEREYGDSSQKREKKSEIKISFCLRLIGFRLLIVATLLDDNRAHLDRWVAVTRLDRKR